MKRILISDTHFGVKNNSITWMNHQIDFIEKQLIPYIQELRKSTNEAVVLYHLGDIFDSRSSINPFVASNVRKSFISLYKAVDDIILIGGNHDYYSPADDSVNSIEMTLHQEYGFNPHIITKDLYYYNGDLFIPWYKYDDVDVISKALEENSVRNIFCHADLPHADTIHKLLFEKYNVFSGHIHTPSVDHNLHTLGSTYALTFADHDAERGFYVLSDDGTIEFIPNKHTIRFWRVWGKDILTYNVDSLSKDDYVELYADQAELLNEVYIKKMEEFATKIHNCMIIPQTHEVNESYDEDVINYDIVEICKRSIPDSLKDKFNIILKKTGDNLTN